jgi:hypothetical protein
MGRPPKLTDAQKAEARRRRAQGATLAELARSYHVGKSTISRLRAGLEPLLGETIQPAKALSLTDPVAALTSKGKSKIAFAYGTNYLIDTKAAMWKPARRAAQPSGVTRPRDAQRSR